MIGFSDYWITFINATSQRVKTCASSMFASSMFASHHAHGHIQAIYHHSTSSHPSALFVDSVSECLHEFVLPFGLLICPSILTRDQC